MGTLEELETKFDKLIDFLTYIYGPNILDDHEPPVVKPTEGFVKKGGWGANDDPDTWKVTRMKDNNKLLKVVDDKGKNVATDFTSTATAQAYIDWFKSTDSGEGEPEGPGPEPEQPPTEPPTEPPTTPGPGKSETKDGIKIPFDIEGEWDYKVTEDWRDGGARFNMKSPGTSVVIVGAFRGNSGDDEVSPKLLMGRHTDDKGNDEHYMGCGYDGGMAVAGGTPRLRLEGPHNHYTKALTKFKTRENVESCHGKFKLYMAAAIQETTGVRFQMYQGTGDNESKPSNDFKLVYDYLDDGTEAKQLTGKNSLDLKFFPIRNLNHTKGTAQSVWRVDATPGLKGKWLAVARVKSRQGA